MDLEQTAIDMSGRLTGCSMSEDGVGKWTEVCALEKPART